MKCKIYFITLWWNIKYTAKTCYEIYNKVQIVAKMSFLARGGDAKRILADFKGSHVTIPVLGPLTAAAWRAADEPDTFGV